MKLILTKTLHPSFSRPVVRFSSLFRTSFGVFQKILGAEIGEKTRKEIRDSRVDLGFFIGTCCHRIGDRLYVETIVSSWRGDASTIEEATPLWSLKQFFCIFQLFKPTYSLYPSMMLKKGNSSKFPVIELENEFTTDQNVCMRAQVTVHKQ